jgi:hypothetical protein
VKYIALKEERKLHNIEFPGKLLTMLVTLVAYYFLYNQLVAICQIYGIMFANFFFIGA